MNYYNNRRKGQCNRPSLPPYACPRHELGKMATCSQFVLLLIFPRPHRARVYLSPVRTHARIIIIALFDEDHHCLLHTPTPPVRPPFPAAYRSFGEEEYKKSTRTLFSTDRHESEECRLPSPARSARSEAD